MKKLFSMMLALLLLFSLTACKEEQELPEVDTITIEVVVSEDHTETYDLEVEEVALLDLINASVELEVRFTSSQYGSYITGIGDINSMTGNYVAISKNGVASAVGIDEITFETDDVITFEILWYDMTAKAVYETINAFVENHADDYVNDTLIDYNVLAALEILDLTDEFITSEEVTNYYSSMELATVADYYKAIIIQGIVGLDTTDLVHELLAMFEVGPYGQTAYGVLAVNSQDVDVNKILFNATASSYFSSNTPYNDGLDTGGINLVALSVFTTKTDTRVSEFLTWIDADQLPSGGIKTRDMVYGETTYPGTENAASIAQVILGMIAVDETPAGETYTIEGNNLVSRLTEFADETGAFSWMIDGEADMLFSTPQAILALVCYQEYINTYSPVNPYILD